MGPVRQNPIQRTVNLFICVCTALCTTVAHNIAQNRPDSFPPYPPDNHHISDDVYLREGGRSLNSNDSFPRWKFKNRAPTSCSPGPILWPTTISFELHAEMVEEIDLELYSYGQLSEVQMLRDLDLDLGSGQGQVSIHSTCRTTCKLTHVTVVSRTTEIWPFEFRQILILDEVWTLVIAFLDGNSKIRLRKAVVQVPYYGHQPSVLSSTPKWRRR